MAWSNKETFKFIELYQSEPAIWDPNHNLHKDRTEVNDAWTRLADSLEIPVTQLKRKKDTLMAAFRLNFKKKQDCIRAGDASYKPIWIYYDVMEEFLKDIYECNTIEGSTSALEQDADVIEEQREQETRGSNNSRGNTINRDYKHKIRGKKRRSIQVAELDTSEKESASHFDPLNQSFLNKDNESEDECDLYGRLLAKKLRKYQEIERQEIMYEIDGLLLKRRRHITNDREASPSHILIVKRPSSSASSYAPASPY